LAPWATAVPHAGALASRASVALRFSRLRHRAQRPTVQRILAARRERGYTPPGKRAAASRPRDTWTVSRRFRLQPRVSAAVLPAPATDEVSWAFQDRSSSRGHLRSHAAERVPFGMNMPDPPFSIGAFDAHPVLVMLCADQPSSRRGSYRPGLHPHSSTAGPPGGPRSFRRPSPSDQGQIVADECQIEAEARAPVPVSVLWSSALLV
jgi:hypothetical protein